MQVANLDRIRAQSEETVQETDSQKEGLVLTLEISEHLDHPIDHPCSQTLCDFVSIQEVSRLILSLQLSQVLVDLFTILRLNVNVLPLQLSCALTWQVHARMLILKFIESVHLSVMD